MGDGTAWKLDASDCGPDPLYFGMSGYGYTGRVNVLPETL
jgi:hypothetical protein